MRLFEIVYILLNKKTIKAKELAELFEVSTRTIYRDIDVLCSCGIPIYTSKGKGGGISLLESYKFDKAMLTKQEQNDIVTSLQSMHAINIDESKETLRKISAFFNSSQVEWLEIDFTQWHGNSFDRGKYQTIKDSIINTKILQIKYSNLKGETTYRQVLPLKIIYKANSWYMQAYCKTKNDYRMFKLTRIVNIEQTYKDFIRPTDIPKINNYKAPIEDNVPIKLLVDKSMAFRIFDDFMLDDITKTPEGDYLVTIPKYEASWITAYILTYGNLAICLEPQAIRDEIKNILEQSLNKYL